ncbi:MAG: RsmE family RNA methyltransferase [Chloroflexota bacterium]
MHRFFVPPDWLHPDRAQLTGPLARQIALVLRLLPGERICVLDDSGWEAEVVLDTVHKDLAAGPVVRRTLAAAEPRTKVTVYQALLKGDHFELVLQKCTEVGAVAFVPLITARTVVGSVGDADSRRFQRWQRIVREAAEQSGRGRLPALRPAELFPIACEAAGGLSLIPWEGEKQRGLRAVLRETFAGAGEVHSRAQRPFSVNIFIGPEGGFSESEIKIAHRYGLMPVSLGPRVLRAETAAVVATAAVLHEAGDLGG